LPRKSVGNIGDEVTVQDAFNEKPTARKFFALGPKFLCLLIYVDKDCSPSRASDPYFLNIRSLSGIREQSLQCFQKSAASRFALQVHQLL
jgi:hypothetical protein